MHPTQSDCQLEQSQGTTDCSNQFFYMNQSAAMIKKIDTLLKKETI